MATQSVRRLCGSVTPIVLAVGLSGCSTFTGQPKPVIETSVVVKTADTRVISRAFAANATNSDRNRMIANFMAAVDARYYDFRGELSKDRKIGGLGFDSAVIGLATAGTLAPKAAATLAGITGGVVGLRGSVDRNVYFDKTLPALIAKMESNRARIGAQLRSGMALSIDQYPAGTALADLQAYQMAGTLDAAVMELTQDAAVDRATTRAAYNRAVGIACDATEETADARSRFDTILNAAVVNFHDSDSNAKAAGQSKINIIASNMNINTTKSDGTALTFDELQSNIIDRVARDFCSAKDIDQLIARIK